MKHRFFLGCLIFLSIDCFTQIDNKVYKWGNLNPWFVTEFSINSKHYYENTVNVIAPGENNNCPNGKIIVMTGQPRPDRRMIISDLQTSEGKINTAKGTNVQLDIDPEFEKLATDNQIIKLKNGDLLAFKLGFLWKPITPKPFWGDWLSDNTTDFKKMARDAIFIYKSKDCGASWTKVSVIDAAKIDKGQYGIPKKALDGNKKQEKNASGDLLWHSNGFDRQEVCYNEQSNMLYMTTQIASGEGQVSLGTNKVTIPAIDKYGLFMTNNNGESWLLKKDDFEERPLLMTTTVNGRFFIFSVSNGKPVLYYTKKTNDYTLNSLTRVEIKYPENGTPLKVEKDNNIHQMNEVNDNVKRTIAIGRGPNNSVYLAYPVLNSSGKCEYVLCNVKINEDHPEIFGIANYASIRIKASDPAHSIDYGTIIESKAESFNYLVDINTKITPKSLFYFIESTSGDNVPATSRKVAVKGILIDHKTNTISDDFFLSRSADNAGRWFKPYTSGGGIGHYTKGTAYIYNDKQNYIAQWPEPDGIHVSIVSGVDMWREDDKELLKNINEMSKQKVFKFPVITEMQKQ
jgi:hypothetical protein